MLGRWRRLLPLFLLPCCSASAFISLWPAFADGVVGYNSVPGTNLYIGAGGSSTPFVTIGTNGYVGIGIGTAAAVAPFEVNGMSYFMSNVGVGTAPSSSYALAVNGGVTATTYFHSSDVRLKTDIRPITHALDKILAPKGVAFKWKKDGRPDIGVTAQNVAATFPDIVSKDGNGTMSVEYDSLIGPMIEAIRELKIQNDRQAAEIKALHAKLEE